MKVGIYDPYFNGPLGGGERYILTVAECLLARGSQVDIFWDGQDIKKTAAEKLKINLSQARFVENIFAGSRGLIKRLLVTKNYDVFFYLSDGSVPFLFARKNFIHMQVPLANIRGKTILNKLKLSFVKAVVCNSAFTKRTIDRVFGVNSVVLYPPVSVEEFTPMKKENVVLGVGRFTQAQHAKKQHVLVESFRKLVKNGLKDWELILVGGTLKADEKYIGELRNLAEGYPIKILTDISFVDLVKLYGKAKIFWHAAGFGEEEQAHPERMEHFGIVVAEAMAAGCVPVVIKRGGIPEIVDNGVNGLVWETTRQLEDLTLNLINSEKMRKTLSERAISAANKFSKKAFCKNLNEIIES